MEAKLRALHGIAGSDPEGLHDQPSEIRIRRRDEVDPARQDRRRSRQIHLGSENLSDAAASHSD